MSAVVSKRIEFRRPDAASCPAYLAEPTRAPQASAVVVVQEWWGLNEQIRSVADRLAEAGHRALAPDLFRGQLAKNDREASHMMDHLNFADAWRQDLRGAVQHLAESSAAVSVMGFCMGGALALLAAMHVPELDSAIVHYGIPPAAAGDPSTIRIPLLLHFAEHDDWCTPERVAALERQLQAGNVNYELHRYDAQHAFMNQMRPEVYAEANAELAWRRSLDFLARRGS